MWKYIDVFLAALNIFLFYINQNGNIFVRGLNLSCAVLIGLEGIIAALDDLKDN